MTTTEPPEYSHHQKPVTQHGLLYNIEHTGDEVLHKVAEKSHIPFWGVLLILVVIVLVLLALFFFVLKKYWTKFRESDKGARFKGLDLKSVNLIGQMGKEKVQPESDGLTANMEENEAEQKEVEVKEAEKLGRLQFKLDYDFNTTNVSHSIQNFDLQMMFPSCPFDDSSIIVFNSLCPSFE
jgi:hypothetical protein